MKTKSLFAIALLVMLRPALAQDYPFRNPELPIDERIDDLIGRLTLDEKAAQMLNSTPAVEHLGIPPYDYWNEALHGVGRSGNATVFPQAIGLGATFDTDLALRVSTAISDEARAMFNAAQAKGNYMRYGGLTFWTPNINIFRDPRWGRGQETYGEDPYLTGSLGSAFVRGLQGDDPKYLKTAACAKHFAVHSGPEKLRHEFNAVSSDKDLYETYLPAFKSLVDAGVVSVMCAYNATNGEPCCANNYLLDEVLRGKWAYKGHVVSDCWAITDFYATPGHGASASKLEAAALALSSGVDVNCGDTYEVLADAVRAGLVAEDLLNQRLHTLLETRFRLGLFDPVDANPYNKISPDVVASDAHRALAYEVALKSAVLLKNNGVLPLKNDLNRYYVVGPNAASIDALLGNYFGMNPNLVTVLEGIAAKIEMGSQIQYSPGTTLDQPNKNPIDWSSPEAATSDVTIMVMGLTRHLEGEEGESVSSPYFGDRLDYNIPANQIDYLKKIKSHGKPVVAVVTGGSPMNLQEVHEIADAVLMVWYPGQEGGNAVADIIFGNASPSGKLPITFPKSLDQLPAYEDYNMEGRTYKYMKEEPMYPFGFGLTYSNIEFSGLTLSKTKVKKGQTTTATCTISNKGTMDTDEVVQLYITDEKASVRTPIFDLNGMQRISLKAGESQSVSFNISTEMLELINNKGESVLEKGTFKVWIGSSLPSERSAALGAATPVSAQLTLK